MNQRQQKKYKELENLVKNRNWELISINYIDCNTKLLFKCSFGHLRKMTPNNFKKGRGCAVCTGCDPVNAKLWFENKVKELGGTIVGEYVNAKTPVPIICNKGHRSNKLPTGLQQGEGICRVCAGNDPKIAEENFINRVIELGGTFIKECISTYQSAEVMSSVPIDNQKGIYLGHSEPNNIELEFTVRTNQLDRESIYSYINAYTHVNVLCKNNHKCWVYPSSIRLGYSLCKICNGSGGEQMVAAALDLLGLDYIGQYTLPGKSFRYDFATGINMINTVIEWDGEQHFKFVKLFHETIEKFIYKQNCDREKTKDIIDLNCKIIRIDYTWGNKSIEEIARSIYLALQSNQQLIVSNPDMYQWLINF